MKLSVIIPTKDRGKVFDRTLRCTANAIQHLDAEIIVVNDSKAHTLSIPAEVRKVKLINNPKQGVASARNAGALASEGDLLLFLDDDILVSRESMDHLVICHEKIGSACLNVNWQYPIDLQEKIEKTQFGRFIKTHQLNSFKGWYSDSSWKDNALFVSKSVASFHLSISREDFKKTRGYNEQFPHAGFEDYDFPMRLKEAGLSFYIDSRVTVFHNESDKMDLANWLTSQERRAATRSVAVQLGFNELELEYGIAKRASLILVLFFSKFIFALLNIVPNCRILDPLYFKLTATLQAAYIFKGYTSQ